MRVEVVANNFGAEIPLTPISNTEGDIRNVIQAQGVDNVGNVGNLSHEDELPPVRMLNHQKSMNVEIKEMAFGLGEDIDQLKDMSVTFLQFPAGDLDHHIIEMSYHIDTPDVDASATAMQGYWDVETDIAGDFIARIKIFFDHPSISDFDFVQLRLVAKDEIDTTWSIIEDAVFVHQMPDPGHGIPELWYVEATVTGFSDFAIIQGKPDLRITDTHIFANPLVSGQIVRISATVRNVGELAGTAEGVPVRVNYTDENGEDGTIGWIDFEDPIEPGKDNEQTGEVLWETPVVTDGEKMTFYVKFKLDPNDEVAEYNEENNDAYIDENNDMNIDPVQVLKQPSLPLFLPKPIITSPSNGSVVEGAVMISGGIMQLGIQTSISPHSHGFEFEVTNTSTEIPIALAEYYLKDAGGVVVPGEMGHARDLYGLRIEDDGVTIAFDDHDRDGLLSIGDAFLVKDLDHGGPASDGYTLELMARDPEAVEISINGGDWIEVTGIDSWNYEWNSTTVEDGDYEIKVRTVDGTHHSTEVIWKLRVENKKDDGDDEAGFLPGFGIAGFVLVLAICANKTRKKRALWHDSEI